MRKHGKEVACREQNVTSVFGIDAERYEQHRAERYEWHGVQQLGGAGEKI
jgi:hypothetical protein